MYHARRARSGQTVSEYALGIALIAALSIVGLSLVSGGVGNIFSSVASQLALNTSADSNGNPDATPTPTPNPTPVPNPTPPVVVTFDVPSPVPGQPVNVTCGNTYVSDANVQVTLAQTGAGIARLLETVSADGTGAVSTSATVPADTAPGVYYFGCAGPTPAVDISATVSPDFMIGPPCAYAPAPFPDNGPADVFGAAVSFSGYHAANPPVGATQTISGNVSLYGTADVTGFGINATVWAGHQIVDARWTWDLAPVGGPAICAVELFGNGTGGRVSIEASNDGTNWTTIVTPDQLDISGIGNGPALLSDRPVYRYWSLHYYLDETYGLQYYGGMDLWGFALWAPVPTP